MGCKSCHPKASTSQSAADNLLPKPSAACDECHEVEHRENNVRPRPVVENPKLPRCQGCHRGWQAGRAGRVAPVVIPEPNLKFSHQKHAARNIGCGHCHGSVGRFELATRQQLPRMAGCFVCHGMKGKARGDAGGDCRLCHLTEPSGRLRTTFSTGRLQPPRWLHGAAHTPDWLVRHKPVAAANSKLCARCHRNKECIGCHDGKTKVARVHPNDWLRLHAISARFDNPRCTNCHQLQTFCGDCHRRVGVARDSASVNRKNSRRFHPAASVWTTAPRGPRHHAWEAMRNLNACVGCHTERDCVTCHATRGLRGGQGVNPHPLNFAAKCGAAFRANPRPCLVCHQQHDAFLSRCR